MERTLAVIALPVLLGLIFLFGGCCTKKECTGFDDLNTVTFSGFSRADVDSIAVEVFATGSAFGNRLDSTFQNAGTATPSDTDYYIFLLGGLDRSHDYRFTLTSAGRRQVFELTHFVVQRETCNSCFPYHPSSNFFDQLRGYSINGRLEDRSQVIIKPT